jgi:hypothetical protein
MKIFKGLPGDLIGIFVGGSEEIRRCPSLKNLYKVPIERRSTPAIKLDAEHDLKYLVLRLPFGPCPQPERLAL